MPLGKSNTNCSTESCRKKFNYDIESDGYNEDTFKNENVSNSGYNETVDANTESVCSTIVANKMKSSFKKHKKLPVKNSNMQIAEIDFLRVMNSYAENNEEKRYENENFCRLNCCRIEKVK